MSESRSAREQKIKENGNEVSGKYSEANQVFMCIRITRELKQIYEQEIKIELGVHIGFPIFVKILTIMGYLNNPLNTTDHSIPHMSSKEEQLVYLAWQTVKSKGDKDSEIYGIDGYIEQQKRAISAQKELEQMQSAEEKDTTIHNLLS
jgi:hypothetical protein